MKKIIFAVVLALAMTAGGNAEVVREGNNFTQVSNNKQAGTSIETRYTYTWNGTTYPVWISKNGRAYIKVTSKSGKPYSKYLPEDIARTICAELGIEYVEPKK